MFSLISRSFAFGQYVGIPNPALYLDALHYSGSGSTWQSFTGPDATLNNAPTFTSTSPTFFEFNGVNQFAEFTHDNALKPTNAITLEQWITADDWTAGDSINYLASLSCTQGGGYAYYIWGGTFRVYVRSGGVYQIPTADVSGFAAGSWHHFVTTFNGQFTRLYVDGVLTNTVDMGTAGNAIGYDIDNSILVGAEATGTTGAAGQYWNGRISLTRIWNRPLLASQVQLLHKQNQTRHSV